MTEKKNQTEDMKGKEKEEKEEKEDEKRRKEEEEEHIFKIKLEIHKIQKCSAIRLIPISGSSWNPYRFF